MKPNEVPPQVIEALAVVAHWVRREAGGNQWNVHGTRTQIAQMQTPTLLATVHAIAELAGDKTVETPGALRFHQWVGKNESPAATRRKVEFIDCHGVIDGSRCYQPIHPDRVHRPCIVCGHVNAGDVR